MSSFILGYVSVLYVPVSHRKLIYINLTGLIFFSFVIGIFPTPGDLFNPFVENKTKFVEIYYVCECLVLVS